MIVNHQVRIEKIVKYSIYIITIKNVILDPSDNYIAFSANL